MDSSTQQNAAMVEQTSASARNLASEVSMLAELTKAFCLDESPNRLPAALAARPAHTMSGAVSLRHH